MATYDDGFAQGKEWGGRPTSGEELQHLKLLRSGMSADDWQKWFIGHDSGRTAFKRIVPAMRPYASGAQSEVAGFWREAVTFGPDLPQRVVQEVDFVRGFAEGALSVRAPGHVEAEEGHERPDENWLDEHGGPSSSNDT